MKTFILDGRDLSNPEDLAKLGALYSRSTKSVSEQIAKVRAEGSGAFLEKYAINYGHESILELAKISVFVEDVSMFAAKALEDDPISSFVECSTRYIDFSTQRFYNPFLEYERAAQWLDKLRKFYVEGTPIQIEYNKKRFPIEEGQSETVYINAIKAKAFDVMRGFLPAGATTNLNWVGDLRTISRRLQELRFHPLSEVQNLAYMLIDQLVAKYPASVRKDRMTDDVKIFMQNNAHAFFYLENDLEDSLANTLPDVFVAQGYDVYGIPGISISHNRAAADVMEDSYKWLKDRPKYGPIPRMPGHAGISLTHTIDFGSFRDIQRHRNCIQKIPLLTTYWGFEDWYLENLAPELQEPANDLLEELFGFIDDVKGQYKAQYLIPMGYRVENVIDMGIPEAVYIAELRSNAGVHPTARRVGTALADFLEQYYPFITIYPDRSESQWDLKRGLATITKKED